MSKQISSEAKSVLGAAAFSEDGKVLTLPSGQLDRKVYAAVNEVLEAAGGKWNRNQRAHLFDADVRQKIAAMLDGGKVVNEAKEAEFFPTPSRLARELVSLAFVEPGDVVLEPSAGRGAIAVEALARGAQVWCCELLDDNRRALRDLDVALVVEPDFGKAEFGEQRFDKVVMNPPFALEIEHVRKAHALLKPGGLLISVMSAGIQFRSDRKTSAFREFVCDCGGEIARNPDGAFRESGTDVRTVTVLIPAVVP